MELNKRIIDEQQIIDGCVRGESWAQKKIYEQYSSAMMSVCVRYVSDCETARDLLQDGFIKLFTKAATYSGTGSFAGWMRRIFVTTALEYLRRNDALKQSQPIDECDNCFESDDVTIPEKIRADDLMACIAQLPNGYRTVFNLYAIEGYSHQEIAGMLRIKEASSRSQFQRARKILQDNVQSLINEDHGKQPK
jgi:RNA polymerase sigma-70 factor (ECF subfamily)